jgi:hypothetical protein
VRRENYIIDKQTLQLTKGWSAAIAAYLFVMGVIGFISLLVINFVVQKIDSSDFTIALSCIFGALSSASFNYFRKLYTALLGRNHSSSEGDDDQRIIGSIMFFVARPVLACLMALACYFLIATAAEYFAGKLPRPVRQEYLYSFLGIGIGLQIGFAIRRAEAFSRMLMSK